MTTTKLTLKEQKKELVNSLINIQNLSKDEKLKAMLHNTSVSVKLDQVESYERKAQNIRSLLYKLAEEKGITKRKFIQKNEELIFDMDDLELIELHKNNQLESTFKF
jgi:hypothetical protein